MGNIKKTDNEKQIENSIFKYLSFDRKIYAFKVETTGVFDPAQKIFRKAGKNVVLGTADIIACLNINGIGIFLALEIKSKYGIQSDKQKLFQFNIQRTAGFYSIVRSINDTEQVIKYARDETMSRMQKWVSGQTIPLPSQKDMQPILHEDPLFRNIERREKPKL